MSRHTGPDCPLHASVIVRFAAAEVLNYDTMMPYRPENLREHDSVKQFYADPAKKASSLSGSQAPTIFPTCNDCVAAPLPFMSRTPSARFSKSTKTAISSSSDTFPPLRGGDE